jgi:hypothetical protein
MNALKLMAFSALTVLSFDAFTQAEARIYIVESFDTYTVRCTSMQTSELPNEVIDRYEVQESSDDTGIISCVLQEEDADMAMPNIEGTFTGYMQNLIGQRTSLHFRPILENNAVSYIATYERTSASPVRFWMTVSIDDAMHEFEF